MLNVEKDLLEAVKNGCGEEQRIKFIKELNDPEIDSALMYNGIIECLGNDDYCDGVYDTILALQKERLENEAAWIANEQDHEREHVDHYA